MIASILARLLPFMRVDKQQTTVLYRFTKINSERLQEVMLNRSNQGLSPKVARVLGAVFLGIPGVILGTWVASVPAPADPAPFLIKVLSFGFAVSLVYSAWLLYTVLLSEQDAASLGWWPISPISLTLAKVAFIVKELLVGAAIVVGPMTLAWLFRGPIPCLSGVGFTVSVLLCIWDAIMIALLLIASLMRRLGVRGTRNLSLVLIALAVFGYFSLIVAEDSVGRAILAITTSAYWPPHGFVLPAAAAGFPPPVAMQWFGAHTLFLIALTWVAFRAVAPGLLAQFSESSQGSRQRSGVLTRYFELWGKNREWRILSRLYLAHVRSDWRFRRHLAALGGWIVVLIAFSVKAGNIGTHMLARDSLTGIFSMGMIAFGAAIIIPVIVFPMLSASSESQAVWIIYAGNIDRLKLALALRKLVRAVYIYPILAIAAWFYFGTSGAPLEGLKHFVLLFLTAELSIAIVHRVYDVFPFTQPADIVKTHSGLLVTGVLAQFMGFVYVIYIFGLALRFWPIYVLTAAAIVWVIAELNRRFRKNTAAAYERLEYLD